MFDKMKNILDLLKAVDLEQLQKISQKIDLGQVLNAVSKMDDNQLKGAMKLLTATSKKKELPPINGDFYHIEEKLSTADKITQLKVRDFMEKEISPIVNNYWLRDEFPFEIIEKFAALNICGYTYDGYGCAGGSSLMEGVIAAEIARVDASIATFFGVQSGLAMGSIYICGSDEQSRSGCHVCSR